MAMPLIVFAFGLNGIGVKKTFLRGTDERYPMTTVTFIFFRAILLGKEAAALHLQAMFGLADNKEWLIENYPSMAKKLKEQRDVIWEQAKSSTAHEVEFLRSSAGRAN